MAATAIRLARTTAQVAYDRAYVADLVDKALRRVRMFLVGLRGEQR
jgi:hypothetical protein